MLVKELSGIIRCSGRCPIFVSHSISRRTTSYHQPAPKNGRRPRLSAPLRPGRQFAPIDTGCRIDHNRAMPFKCDIPAVPTQLQDDDAVRITRWDFEPGAVTGQHRHGWPYFVVMLTDGNLRAEVDGVVQDRPMTAGDQDRGSPPQQRR